MNHMENHVGIRKLRENLSVYLRRVPQGADVGSRLIADGRLIARVKDSGELINRRACVCSRPLGQLGRG